MLHQGPSIGCAAQHQYQLFRMSYAAATRSSKIHTLRCRQVPCHAYGERSIQPYHRYIRSRDFCIPSGTAMGALVEATLHIF